MNGVRRALDRLLRRGDRMRREERLHLLGSVRAAESSSRLHQVAAHHRRHLGMHLIPVFLDVIPRDRSSVTAAQGHNEKENCVLITNLTGGRIIQRTAHQRGIMEIGQRDQGGNFHVRIVGRLAQLLQLVEQMAVTIFRRNHHCRPHQRRLHASLVRDVFVRQLFRLRDNLRIATDFS